jgi:hypothetical protein
LRILDCLSAAEGSQGPRHGARQRASAAGTEGGTPPRWSLGGRDLTAARSYAERSVAAAGESHMRGQVHRLATLATILAGQGEADAAAGIAGQMLDRATGMESCRIQDRIIAVRNAVTAVSDGMAARELAERVEDVIGVPM